jgi:hypothetical protein
LRATGFANYFGADLGEVLATARRITDGDQASWHRARKATAARVAELGEPPDTGHHAGKPVAGVELTTATRRPWCSTTPKSQRSTLPRSTPSSPRPPDGGGER